jgi:hypothetical protein
MVFIIAAGANILAAVLAIAVLKPWRARVIDRSSRDVALDPTIPAEIEHGVRGNSSRKGPTGEEFNALEARVMALEQEQRRHAHMLRTQSADSR